HKPVQFYPGKHPCEKPADMLRQIINASSRLGDLVADFFMGSGSTIKAAMALGRRALGDGSSRWGGLPRGGSVAEKG
ncbi:TPA: site-specific DNA-methyltransferase, partial [Escherichia coli]|nr:site-specific DNA-methyltransferase [Escherichia coli]